jgi:hypothetical protein
MLNNVDRMSLILRIVRHLRDDADQDWNQVDFVLSGLGFDTSDGWIEDKIGRGTDEQICELAQVYRVELPASAISPPAEPGTAPPAMPAEPLFIFASHLTKHKVLVGGVSQALAAYGISMFVAHETIQHDKLWQDEIEKALDRADAGVVFVHDGLKDSPWCDQEIGWLQGRHVPVMALKFDTAPHGFFGKYQAQQMPIGATAEQVAELTLDRLASRPELSEKLNASLASAMAESPNFATTDAIWRRLRERTICDPAVALQLLDALKFNTQVHWAACKPDGRRLYVEVVVEFLQRQPCADAIAEKVDKYIEYRDEPDPVEQHLMMNAFYDERDGKTSATA